jgi:chromate transporter
VNGDLLKLAAVFLRVGLLAFGGSTGVLAELQHQLVQEQHWLTAEQFANSFALGQLTPGPALVMVMFAGYRIAGATGALVSLIAIFLPSALLMCLAIANWQALRRSPWLNSARRGLSAVAFGLTAAGAYTIVRLAVTDVVSIVVAVGAFVVLLRWHLPPALVILLGGLAAFLLGLVS